MIPNRPPRRAPLPAGLALAPAFLGVSACGIAFSPEPGAEQIEVFTEEFAPGDHLEIRNTNGRITIESWEQAAAEITARKVGSNRSAVEAITVEIVRTSDGVRVRTLTMRRGGAWGQRRGRVDYQVRVPRRADLRIDSVNGPVEVSDIEGEIEAQTVNGPIRLRGHDGNVTAQTLNGRIECELERFGHGTEHSFRTANGRVDLTFGPGANGRVDAAAMNGQVLLDLDGAEHLDAPTRGRKRVQIGDGDGECRVRTVNGAIHIQTADR